MHQQKEKRRQEGRNKKTKYKILYSIFSTIVLITGTLGVQFRLEWLRVFIYRSFASLCCANLGVALILEVPDVILNPSNSSLRSTTIPLHRYTIHEYTHTHMVYCTILFILVYSKSVSKHTYVFSVRKGLCFEICFHNLKQRLQFSHKHSSEFAVQPQVDTINYVIKSALYTACFLLYNQNQNLGSKTTIIRAIQNSNLRLQLPNCQQRSTCLCILHSGAVHRCAF